jgi:hypothetical protein
MKQTEESKESREIVYFLLCEDFVKIGKVTAINQEDINDPVNERKVLNRLSACKTGNPNEIYLLGYLFGKEDYWHRVFYEHKHRGEWYVYEGLKGIIFNLRLQPSRDYLQNWKFETCDALETQIDEMWKRFGLNKFEQERKKKELQLKIDRIKNYDWDQYILEVSDIGYRDIAKTVIDNRFTKRNSFKQLEINKTKNFSSENWQLICEALSLLFRTNVEYKEKRKESIVDEFHDVIHEGEMYYNLNIYSNMAHGLTIRNAVFLYENMHESIRNLAIENMEKRQKEHREAINSMYKRKQENKSNEVE